MLMCYIKCKYRTRALWQLVDPWSTASAHQRHDTTVHKYDTSLPLSLSLSLSLSISLSLSHFVMSQARCRPHTLSRAPAPRRRGPQARSLEYVITYYAATCIIL